MRRARRDNARRKRRSRGAHSYANGALVPFITVEIWGGYEIAQGCVNALFDRSASSRNLGCTLHQILHEHLRCIQCHLVDMQENSSFEGRITISIKFLNPGGEQSRGTIPII